MYLVKFGVIILRCNAAEWRFNDGKPSPTGILILGRMHSNWRADNPGRVYRLDWPAAGAGKLEQLMGPEDGMPSLNSHYTVCSRSSEAHPGRCNASMGCSRYVSMFCTQDRSLT